MIWSFCSEYYPEVDITGFTFIIHGNFILNTLLKHGKFDINLIFIEAVHVWCFYKVRSNIYNFNITSYCEKLTLKTQLECIIR
jgi:hypothetical protein